MIKEVIDAEAVTYELNMGIYRRGQSIKGWVTQMNSLCRRGYEFDSDDLRDIGDMAGRIQEEVNMIKLTKGTINLIRGRALNTACNSCSHNTGYDDFGMCLCTEYVETLPKNQCDKYDEKK